MPTVRRYARQVQPTPAPGTRRTAAETPESLGAGLAREQARTAETAGGFFGQAAGLAVNVAAKIRAEEIQRANEAVDLKTSNQLADLSRELLEGERGLLRLQGEDAVKAGDVAVLGEFRKRASDLEKGLTEAQRPLFARRKAQAEEYLHTRALRHVVAQQEVFEANEYAAGIEHAGRRALAHPLELREVGLGVREGERLIRDRGDTFGYGPERIAQELAAFRSAINAGEVRLLLSLNQPKSAAAYFAEAREFIAADQRDGLEEAVRLGGVLGQAQTLADRIRATHLPDVPLSTWLDAIPATAPAEVRARATDELRVRDSIRKAEARDRYESTLDDVFGEVLAGRPPDVVKFSALTGRDQATVASLRGTIAKRQEPDTNYATYADLFDLMRDETAFAAANLRGARAALSDEHYAYFLKQQQEIRAKRPEAARAANIDTEQFNVLAAGAGLNAYEPTTRPHERERLGRLRDAVEREIDRRQADTKKALTRPEKEAVMKQILDDDVLVGWQQTRRPIVTVRPDEQQLARVPLAEVPDATLVEFRNRVRSLSPATFRLSDTEVDKKYRDRFERAAAARALRLGEAAVLAILQGK